VLELERIRAARADDRPAARQDPRDLLRAELLEQRLDEPPPALAHRDDVPTPSGGTPHHGADDRVQARAIAAPGEDPDALRHPLCPSGPAPQPQLCPSGATDMRGRAVAMPGAQARRGPRGKPGFPREASEAMRVP